MRGHIRWLIVIVLLTIFAGWVSLPSTEGVQWQYDSDGDGTPDISFAPHQSLGLDLVGGLRVLLQAELPPGSYTVEDLRQTANNVARRVNALGVTEPTVQVQGSSRILVELPGETDPESAISAIQQTALLEFVNFSGLSGQVAQYEGQRVITSEQVLIQQQRDAAAAASAEAGDTTVQPPEAVTGSVNPVTGQPFQTVMTGAGLQAAAAQIINQSWVINFELNNAGGEVFGPYTAANIGQPMAIVLDGIDEDAVDFRPTYDGSDEEPVVLPGAFPNLLANGSSGIAVGMATNIPPHNVAELCNAALHLIKSPNARTETLVGHVPGPDLPTGGIISGDFTEEEAKTLALQLRSGALPIPLRVETAETVGATLGQESVTLSIRAGVIGVAVVLLFMLIYYRVPGIAADLALLVFIALNMALFKLIPITLTLPAIVGFLISIGSAVDGNILIFERIKEELRNGAPLNNAVEAGFDRAWQSIRDSNLSTIIICGILFLFGQTPGASIVAGFAVTLAIGLIVNLFTAVVVTRTFLGLIVGGFYAPLAERKWLLGV